MNVNKEWTDDVITELDKTIARGNVDKDTLELMKELLKGAKIRASMEGYIEDQE
jgi:hypothetical protein